MPRNSFLGLLTTFQHKIGLKLGNGFAQALPIIVFGHQQNAVAQMLDDDF
jgi:hypothetical protein